MAITVSAALVSTLVADAARPGYSAPNMGWNNRVGDPHWIADIDWYRRVQLSCTGNAGEVITTVNWEVADPTIPMKTAADITAATAGSVASPYGATINHIGTWTVWVTTGVATAAQPKYTDTGRPVVSLLRANGPRVQVVLGKKKLAVGTTETYTVAAFLPGAFKVPTGTATVVVQAPFSVGGIVATMSAETPGRVVLDLEGAPGQTVWDFGDGTSDTQGDNHTVHHYTAPGIYTVRALGTGTSDSIQVEVAAPEEPTGEAQSATKDKPGNGKKSKSRKGHDDEQA